MQRPEIAFAKLQAENRGPKLRRGSACGAILSPPLGHFHRQHVQLALEIDQQQIGLGSVGHVGVKRLGGAGVGGAHQGGGMLQVVELVVQLVQSCHPKRLRL